METKADKLNAVLARNGVVTVTTCTHQTRYTKKHAGHFIMSVKMPENLYVRHGKRFNQLSIGNTNLVAIRTYNAP